MSAPPISVDGIDDEGERPPPAEGVGEHAGEHGAEEPAEQEDVDADHRGAPRTEAVRDDRRRAPQTIVTKAACDSATPTA